MFLQDLLEENLITEKEEELLSAHVDAQDEADPVLAVFLRTGPNSYRFLEMILPVMRTEGILDVKYDRYCTAQPATLDDSGESEETPTSKHGDAASPPAPSSSLASGGGAERGGGRSGAEGEVPGPPRRNKKAAAAAGGGDAAWQRPAMLQLRRVARDGGSREGGAEGGPCAADWSFPNVNNADACFALEGGSEGTGGARGVGYNTRRAEAGSGEWAGMQPPIAPARARRPNVMELTPDQATSGWNALYALSAETSCTGTPRAGWMEANALTVHRTSSLESAHGGKLMEITMTAALTIKEDRSRPASPCMGSTKSAGAVSYAQRDRLQWGGQASVNAAQADAAAIAVWMPPCQSLLRPSSCHSSSSSITPSTSGASCSLTVLVPEQTPLHPPWAAPPTRARAPAPAHLQARAVPPISSFFSSSSSSAASRPPPLASRSPDPLPVPPVCPSTMTLNALGAYTDAAASESSGSAPPSIASYDELIKGAPAARGEAGQRWGLGPAGEVPLVPSRLSLSSSGSFSGSLGSVRRSGNVDVGPDTPPWTGRSTASSGSVGQA